MANPMSVIDGAHQYGSRTITFSNGCVAIMEDFKINTGATKAEDRTATGAPQRMRLTRERYTGTGTLQLPSTISATSKPKFGDTFTVTASTFDSNYDNILFVVDKPMEYDESNDAGAIRKGPCTFTEVISGSVTTSST